MRQSEHAHAHATTVGKLEVCTANAQNRSIVCHIFLGIRFSFRILQIFNCPCPPVELYVMKVALVPTQPLTGKKAAHTTFKHRTTYQKLL